MTTNDALHVEPVGRVVIGVDTHKDIHVAAVMDATAGILATLSIGTDAGGFARLLVWARSFGTILAFGIEGTGSYGASLTAYLHDQGFRVVEAGRPNRQDRRNRGKSDTLDAENAARAVLAGIQTVTPKSKDGRVEMIRSLKVAYETAMKARTQAMNALKSQLIFADEHLRDAADGLRGAKLARHLAALRPRGMTTVPDANRVALRSIARRWLALDAEATELQAMIVDLVEEHAPQLLTANGVGAIVAADILVAVGDNPERIDSEAALAKIAGIAPLPTGSGKTAGRHRLNRGGDRRLNAAIYRIVLCRMHWHEPTRTYVARRTLQGKTKPEIIRCLKRYVTREIYQLIKTDPHTGEITA